MSAVPRTGGVALLAIALVGCGGPRPDAAAAPAPRVETYRDVDARALRAVIFEAARDSGVVNAAVLLLHGGAPREGTPESVFPAARAFARAGMLGIAVEYRSPDSVHTQSDALEDVCAALSWTRAHAAGLGIDSARVAVYGVSTGGRLAAATVTVGCSPRGADALVLLSPALDAESFARPSLSPPPTMIAHGERDTHTPLEQSQRFCIMLVRRRVQCELRVYAGLGHLLTTDLETQERAVTPDPLARADALEKQVEFLRALWAR